MEQRLSESELSLDAPVQDERDSASFGEFIPAEGESAEDHIASHPKDKHGKHEYSLEGFGLTREQVRDRFVDYCARFGV